MTQYQKTKQYDLEDRTREFAQNVRDFVRKIPRNIQNAQDGKQLIRSSGSIGANYIEANEALSRKDFIFRIKISRKESKESVYWLSLIDIGGVENLEAAREVLAQEATELMKIMGAILLKSGI
jgi:four helix bundle protein